MSGTRSVKGPVGVVGAGYIGHLFAQQFALAGYEVRAWSPASSVHTLHDRLRQSVSTLAEIGAVETAADHLRRSRGGRADERADGRGHDGVLRRR